MYPVYIEQYPSSSIIDYLLRQERRKEQEAMYYYRLQQERALRQEQERKRRLLAYYQQQQQEYKKRRRMQEYPFTHYLFCNGNEEEQDLDESLDYISRKSRSLNINNKESDPEEEEEVSDPEEEEEVSDPEEEQAIEYQQEDEYEEKSDLSDSEELATTEEELQTEFNNESEEVSISEAKKAKLSLLKDIEQELESIRKEKEQSILGTQLDFGDSDSIFATTFENKQFLGYEDQIMKLLLKLDMIESDGDQDIRTERKSLVQLAESMLETLDDFKHKEWERISHSSLSEGDDDF